MRGVHEHRKRSVVAAIAALVLFTCLAQLQGSVLGASRPAAAQSSGPAAHPVAKATPPLKVGEQPNRRTRTSTTKYDGGNSFTTSLYQSPVNYKDAKGNWQPISDQLVADATAGYSYRNQANSFAARFGKTSDSHLMSFSTPSGTWTVQLNGAQKSPGRVNGNAVSYAGVVAGTDLKYAVGATGVEETLALHSAHASSQYDFTLVAPHGIRPVVTELPDGSWMVSSAGSPEPLFVLDAPIATDATQKSGEAPDSSHHVSLAASVSGTSIRASIDVDAAWLQSPARVFPVQVDPTVTLQPEAQDGSWAVCTGCTSGPNPPGLWVGSDDSSLFRSAVQFGLSGMPAGATVTSASLGLYYHNVCIGTSNPQFCDGTSHTIDAHQVTAPWSQTTTSDQMQYSSTVLSSATLSAATLGSPQWLNWDITSLFEGWLAGATANDGIELVHNPESTGLSGPVFATQYDTSQSPSNYPEIVVTYTTNAVTLLQPSVVHSNGAELIWTPYLSPTGTPFSSNTLYRSLAPNFTPGPATLVTGFTDPAVTSYIDTTAAPNHTYYYKMVTNGNSWSQEVAVTTPADGTANLALQPGFEAGKDTWIASNSCSNYGTDAGVWVGSGPGFAGRGLVQFDLHSVPQGSTVNSATLSMYALYGANGAPSSGTIHTYRVTRAWTTGSGYSGCTGDGATWYESVGGTNWTTPGGDFDLTADGGSTIAGNESAQWHTFDVAAIAQRWANGSAPDLGILLVTDGEPQVVGSESMPFESDGGSDPTRYPKLTMNYNDSSHAVLPAVAVSTPGSGATVSGGSVTLGASPSGPNPITQVQFIVDGAQVGNATTAPWQMAWNSTSVSNGSHTLTEIVTDSAGSTATSAAVQISVGNYGPPSVAVTAPGANASLTGTVTVSANASAPAGTSVSRVDLYVDNIRLASLTTAPYSYSWNTLDGTVYDGAHTITATAYDADGESATSSAVAVSLTNTSGSEYQALFSATSIPQTVVYDPNNSNTYTVPVSITNSSRVNWSSSVYLCYRWVSLDTSSSASADQSVPCAGSVALKAGKSTTSPINVTVPAPQLGTGVDQAQFQLWFDLYENGTHAWFSAKGNQPNLNPVTVNHALRAAGLGLENYYQYTQDQVGAGMDHMLNIANGDSLLTWTPFDLPGKGLATVVRLTYNSLEDHSDSLLGSNWSLGISSLTRFGLPLDLHTGGNYPWIALIDGDGTYHRFQGAKDSGGNVYYVEPPGVHLYLRQVNSTGTKTWAFTRPDRTTFYYDQNGFPTSVVDKNGQTLTFAVSAISPSDDPGNLKFHVTAVTDQGGRAVTINYFDHSSAPKPKIRGLVRGIIDHDGHELDFTYNDDGNLARITQRGGVNADGSFLADRNWSLTYTASGDGTVQAGNTAAESTKVYSITDPLGRATVFNYVSSGQDKWKLSSETDRSGSQTAISYNDSAFSTTVNAPLSRTTTYVYDSTGQPTSIQQNLNGTTLTTGMQWNTDFAVTQVTDANNHPSTLAWNNDGDLTDQTDQNGNHTKLTYQLLTVDGNDSSSHWCPSGGSIFGQPCAPRTQAHLGQLLTKQDPNGVAAGSGFTWNFGYDTSGNLKTITDPNQKPSTNYYNADGTLAQSIDANNHATNYTTYDANGLATTITDPMNRTTTRNFDADGLLIWSQDPLHQSGCPTACSLANGAEYRTVNAYDSFGRLGLTTQPKSTQNALGTLVEKATGYDANNNVVVQSLPFYSKQAGQSITTAYDAMDRRTLVTVPDTAADPAGERTGYSYDAAGRLVKETLPVGEQSGTPNNTHTVNFGYDTLDRQISQTVYHVDSGGVHAQATLTCYDNLGDTTSVTQPNAGLTSISCPAASTTPFTTFLGYDNGGRRTSQTDPDGHLTTPFYDHDGNVTGVKDPNGNTTSNTYDQLNRLIRTDQPFINGPPSHAATTEYQYDNVGNLTALISPRAYDASSDKQTFTSYVTGYSYDADNERIQMKLPTDASYSTQYYVLQGYDANGNQTAVSKPVTTTDITTLTSAQEAQTQYFDTGWISSNQAAGGPLVGFDYNAMGEQSSRTSLAAQGAPGSAQLMQWFYYPDGQIQQSLDNGQQPVQYTYSADNVLLSSHNAAGITDPSQHPVDTQNSVDDLDRVTRTDERPELPQGGSPWTFASYSYDANNNLTDQVVNGQESTVNGTVTNQGRSLHDDFDPANWLTDQYDCGMQGYSTTCPNAQRTLEQFTNNGQESHRELDQSNASGAWSLKQLNTWDYYANGKLNHATTSNQQGATLQSDVVSYLDPTGIYVDGNRTQDVFTLQQPSGGSSPCATSSCTATYTYDPRDHLVANNDGHGNAYTFNLDPSGNILSQADNGSTTATYTYTGDQVATQTTGGSTVKYWYDALGRQLCTTTTAGSSTDCSVAQGSTAPASVLTLYGYDYLDRLDSYRGFANGSQTDLATYTYDALNRVVSETESHPNLSSPRTTSFSYAGLSSQLTEEQLSTNQQTTEAKDYGYDPAGHLLSFTDTPYSNGTPQSPTTYTYGVNVHDSVDMLVNPSGGVSASYGYQPYGQADSMLTQGDTNTTSPLNPMRFEQKRLDSGSQSYSTGVRNYSPGNNHFLTPDVFHGALADLRLSNDPLTQDRYALTGGNPTSFIDWSGHMLTTDGSAGGMPADYSNAFSGGGSVANGGISSQPANERDIKPGALGGASGGPSLDTEAYVVSACGSAQHNFLGHLFGSWSESCSSPVMLYHQPTAQDWNTLCATQVGLFQDCSHHAVDVGIVPYLGGTVTLDQGDGLLYELNDAAPAAIESLGHSMAAVIVPRPGSRGGEPHQNKIQDVIDSLKGQGYQHLFGGKSSSGENVPEEYIRTPNGVKTARRPDATFRTPAGDLYRINVGQATQAGFPIAREVDALEDISKETGEDIDFVPYNFEP